MKNILDIQRKYHGKIDPLDLDLIISHVLDKPREFVLSHPEHTISESKIKNLKSKISRRFKGEPIAYITGHKEFYGLDFKVTKNTLVPRPETEMLVDEGIKKILDSGSKAGMTLIDIGTGSGNIIISIASQLKNKESRIMNYEFYGTDISKKALEVAKQNAKKHSLNKKIKFLHGDLLEPLIKNLSHVTDHMSLVIVANLPYLDNEWKNLLKSTETKGLKYEPNIALYSGKDGLDAYRELSKQVKKLTFMAKSITLICEIGHLQRGGMKKIFSFAKKVSFKKDLSGSGEFVL